MSADDGRLRPEGRPIWWTHTSHGTVELFVVLKKGIPTCEAWFNGLFLAEHLYADRFAAMLALGEFDALAGAPLSREAPATLDGWVKRQTSGG